MKTLTKAWVDGPLQRLLGLRHPLVLGPFGGGSSSVALTSAVATAGGLGSFGAHALTPDAIRSLVEELRASTSGVFAVNLWVPQPGEGDLRLSDEEFTRHVDRLRPYLTELDLPEPMHTNSFARDYQAQVQALLESRPPAISFVMGIPDDAIISAAKRDGIVTIGTASTVEEAVALETAGIDVIVASGSDAGGHRGAFLRPVQESLVGTFSLVPQVVDAVAVPVVAAGGIADARGVVAALALGADGVQVGTAFLGTHESGASAVHKHALHSEQARTTVLTRVFSGRLARAIPNRFQREMTAFEDDVPPYPVQNALTANLRKVANERGVPDLVHLWAGQAASLTSARPAAELYAQLTSETELLLGLRQ